MKLLFVLCILLILSLTPISSVYVVWLCNDNWERDYIREVFPLPKYQHIYYNDFKDNSTIFDANNKHNWPHVFVFNVENSGPSGKYELLIEIINKYKPAVLVHLSDEFQGWAKKWKYGEGVEVYKYVPLVLREYAVKPYISYEEPRSNVIQIPLGYIKDMFFENSTRIPSTDMIVYSNSRKSESRSLMWTFIGEVRAHKDRATALEVFREWKPNFVDAGIKPSEVAHIYNNSLFVIVGRGQKSLDCLKIYEAMICGAVPIVVAESYELEWTFAFEGDFPPLLTAETFPDALEKCKNLTFSQIDEQRERLMHWYINRMKLMRVRSDYYVSRQFHYRN